MLIAMFKSITTHTRNPNMEVFRQPRRFRLSSKTKTTVQQQQKPLVRCSIAYLSAAITGINS